MSWPGSGLPPALPDRRPLIEGTVVAGAYVVEHIVGEGASGEVWAATDSATGARVALKVLLPGAAEDHELAERFRREAYFLARTASEHVARIHDFVCDPQVGMVLVMELVEGESLSALLDRKVLSVEEAIELGIDLLAGVLVLHNARVVHRDLKPGNILMRPIPGGRTRPVICDFGLSRLVQKRRGDSLSGPSLTGLTKGDVAMGTVKYMAPEQLLNARQATEQSDLYAVGAILHRAVTGYPPFGELDSPHEIARAKVIGEAPLMECGRNDATGRGFLRVVTKAVRRRPGERHPDAASMRAELEKLAELVRLGEGDTQKTPTRLSPAPDVRRERLKRSPLLLAAGAVAIFAGGVTTGRVWTGDRIRIDVIPSSAERPIVAPQPEAASARAPMAAPSLAPSPAVPAELRMPTTILEVAATPAFTTPPAVSSALAKPVASVASAVPLTAMASSATPPRASAAPTASAVPLASGAPSGSAVPSASVAAPARSRVDDDNPY